MAKEVIILMLIWIIMIAMLLLLVPKNKIRDAFLVFLFQQVITWPIGLIVVELNWIDYPVRLFQNANKSSFTFEYFVYPAICALFVIHFPDDKSRISKICYFVAYCSVLTICEALIERYTRLIDYIHWSWYWTWITLFITFLLSRMFYLWFMRKDIKTL